jgi:hypothetical protein
MTRGIAADNSFGYWVQRYAMAACLRSELLDMIDGRERSPGPIYGPKARFLTHAELRIANTNKRESAQHSEYIQQPQNHQDNHHDIQYLLDAPLHGYVVVD